MKSTNESPKQTFSVQGRQLLSFAMFSEMKMFFFSISKFYEQIQSYNQFVDINRYNKEKFLNSKLKLGEAVIYWHNVLGNQIEEWKSV